MNIYYKGAYRPAIQVAEMRARDRALASKQIEDAKKEVKKEEVVLEEVKEETPELTKDEMKAKLKEAGVEFHVLLGETKLKALMAEHNLN